MSDALRELGALHGIDGAYWDIWGERHPTSPETDRALLTAMGVELDDLDRALIDARRSGWDVGIPAVVVAATDAVAIELVLPRAAIAETYRWRVRGEAADRAGEMVPQETDWVADGPEDLLRYRFTLPSLNAPGYYRLSVQGAGIASEGLLIAPPSRCVPLAASGERFWGLAVQLYSLRSERNWGIGDFTDLGDAAEAAAALGAEALGVSPLHMLFLDDPEQASPYSPSSRQLLNPLYIDVEAVPEVARSAAATARIAEDAFAGALVAARAAELVAYATVSALKREVLQLGFAELEGERAARFDEFRAGRGEALERAAVFAVMRESPAGPDPAGWPEEWADPGSPEVAEFARVNARAVEFQMYLQWLADEQLGQAAARAREAGMRIGLYGDLALGAAGGGADVWSQPDSHARGVGLGAPPDDFSPLGQAWGLPPMLPARLEDDGIMAFAAVVRAAMRHMGAIRLDHVMGLRRLFWVVEGQEAADGAYVDYPFEELLAVVALESWRHGCAVVGEDLGTVPEEVRSRLEERGVLSYKVLWFEKRWEEDGAFLAPREYAEQSLATASTHDLPTIAGFWRGNDIQHRADLGLLPSEETAEKLIHERALDRLHLRDLLVDEGLVEPNAVITPAELHHPVHQLIARTSSILAMVQLEDVLGESEQANLPGTVDEHPNWRRRTRLPIAAWTGSEPFTALVSAMAERGARHPDA